jgi:hypothetical protein
MNKPSATNAATPATAAIPIPAFAPVLRPELELEDLSDGGPVFVGDEDDVVLVPVLVVVVDDLLTDVAVEEEEVVLVEKPGPIEPPIVVVFS